MTRAASTCISQLDHSVKQFGWLSRLDRTAAEAQLDKRGEQARREEHPPEVKDCKEDDPQSIEPDGHSEKGEDEPEDHGGEHGSPPEPAPDQLPEERVNSS